MTQSPPPLPPLPAIAPLTVIEAKPSAPLVEEQGVMIHEAHGIYVDPDIVDPDDCIYYPHLRSLYYLPKVFENTGGLPTGDNKTMREVFQNYIYVVDEKAFKHKVSNLFLKEYEFNQVFRFAHKRYYNLELNTECPKGELPSDCAREICNSVDTIGYDPTNKEFLFRDIDGSMAFNSYRETNVEEIPCDDDDPIVQFMVSHFHRVCGVEEGEGDFVLDYIAHNVCNPGVKIPFAVVIYGEEKTGKSKIGELVVELMGNHNANAVDTSIVIEKYEDWVARKTFLYIDDLAKMPKSFHSNMKTKITTEKRTTIRRSGLPVLIEHIYANFLFLTNEEDAIKMEKASRRFYVCGVDGGSDEEYRIEFDKFYKDPECVGKMLYYFKHMRDISQFDIGKTPPITAMKRRMVKNTKDRYELAVYNVIHGRAGVEQDDKFKVDIALFGDVLDAVENVNAHNNTIDRAGLEKIVKACMRREPDNYMKLDRMRLDKDGNRGLAYLVRNHAYWVMIKSVCGGNTSARNAEYRAELNGLNRRDDVDVCKGKVKIHKSVLDRLIMNGVVVKKQELIDTDSHAEYNANNSSGKLPPINVSNEDTIIALADGEDGSF